MQEQAGNSPGARPAATAGEPPAMFLVFCHGGAGGWRPFAVGRDRPDGRPLLLVYDNPALACAASLDSARDSAGLLRAWVEEARRHLEFARQNRAGLLVVERWGPRSRLREALMSHSPGLDIPAMDWPGETPIPSLRRNIASLAIHSDGALMRLLSELHARSFGGGMDLSDPLSDVDAIQAELRAAGRTPAEAEPAGAGAARAALSALQLKYDGLQRQLGDLGDERQRSLAENQKLLDQVDGLKSLVASLQQRERELRVKADGYPLVQTELGRVNAERNGLADEARRLRAELTAARGELAGTADQLRSAVAKSQAEKDELQRALDATRQMAIAEKQQFETALKRHRHEMDVTLRNLREEAFGLHEALRTIHRSRSWRLSNRLSAARDRLRKVLSPRYFLTRGRVAAPLRLIKRVLSRLQTVR